MIFFSPPSKEKDVYVQPLLYGEIAQSVEQRTENPCVGGSIPPLATVFLMCASRWDANL